MSHNSSLSLGPRRNHVAVLGYDGVVYISGGITKDESGNDMLVGMDLLWGFDPMNGYIKLSIKSNASDGSFPAPRHAHTLVSCMFHLYL